MKTDKELKEMFYNEFVEVRPTLGNQLHDNDADKLWNWIESKIQAHFVSRDQVSKLQEDQARATFEDLREIVELSLTDSSGNLSLLPDPIREGFIEFKKDVLENFDKYLPAFDNKLKSKYIKEDK